MFFWRIPFFNVCGHYSRSVGNRFATSWRSFLCSFILVIGGNIPWVWTWLVGSWKSCRVCNWIVFCVNGSFARWAWKTRSLGYNSIEVSMMSRRCRGRLRRCGKLWQIQPNLRSPFPIAFWRNEISYKTTPWVCTAVSSFYPCMSYHVDPCRTSHFGVADLFWLKTAQKDCCSCVLPCISTWPAGLGSCVLAG